jgi:hypothetical protein
VTWTWGTAPADGWLRWRIRIAFHRHQAAHWAWLADLADMAGDRRRADAARIAAEGQQAVVHRLELAEP